MSIFLNNSEISSTIKLGNNNVSKIFLGNNLIFGCLDTTASVKMTGWEFGDRTLAPIGYSPYSRETYQYGDETVRYETGVWIYENSTLGEITRVYSYADWPWLADWAPPYGAEKICAINYLSFATPFAKLIP